MDNFSSYCLYVATFTVSVFWAWQYDKRKHIGVISSYEQIIWLILIALPSILLQGFRYGVGTDYYNYAELCEGLCNGNSEYWSWYLSEPIFIWICKIAYFIGNQNKYFFFIVNAVLKDVLLFYIFDYYKDEVSLPVLYAFYYSLCFPYFMNIERQGLAVIIIWYSTKYVLEKKPLKFLACVIVATLIHNTAIIGVLLYLPNLICFGRLTNIIKTTVVAVSLFVPVLFGLSISFLSNYVAIFAKYRKFLNNASGTVLNVNHLYTLGLLVILIPFINKLKKSKMDIWWLAFLWAWQLSSYLLNIYIRYGFRISFYFEIGLFCAYGYVIPRLQKKYNRCVVSLFLLSALVFHFTYKFYIQGNSEIFPYQSIFCALI